VGPQRVQAFPNRSGAAGSPVDGEYLVPSRSGDRQVRSPRSYGGDAWRHARLRGIVLLPAGLWARPVKRRAQPSVPHGQLSGGHPYDCDSGGRRLCLARSTGGPCVPDHARDYGFDSAHPITRSSELQYTSHFDDGGDQQRRRRNHGTAALASFGSDSIALGFLRVKGQNAGWFGPPMGLVLHVVATMLLLALFIWWNAAALDRMSGENGRFKHAVQDTQTALLEILGRVQNAAFAHDLIGNLTFFNAAAERLFGVPAQEALRNNIFSVITPQSAASVRSILSSRLIGGVRRPELLVLRTSAGEQECEVLTVLMCDHKGNPAGFFSLVSPLVIGAAPVPSAIGLVLDRASVG
jgi:PAS domain S-box-containing protein